MTDSEKLADWSDAQAYMTRLIQHIAPDCYPLHTLVGLASQLDNYIAGLHIEALVETLRQQVKDWRNEATRYRSFTDTSGKYDHYAQALDDCVEDVAALLDGEPRP